MAETLRIATWHVALARKGPGLLLHELTGKPRAATVATVAGLVALDADVVLLTDVDFDAEGRALAALAGLLAQAGADYPHRFALLPNRGMPTGLDLDGDGLAGGPGDAQGFGPFGGWGGMAVLSRLPIAADEVRDFSAFLWADLPGALMPDVALETRRVQRLASTGFWDVPVILPQGGRLRLLAFHAAPPLDDRNRRRGHDEMAFWLHLLDGKLPFAPPAPPFVLLGDAQTDPVDGDGQRAALLALLAHPALQDPAPQGGHGRVEPDHLGDPAQDTVDYGRRRGLPGALRVDYVLPSADLAVVNAGVLWPPDSDPLAADLARASRHRPVWVDISLPGTPLP